MAIILNHLHYIYNEGTSYEKHALCDVNIEIDDGEFVGIIGHTGSGKSTVIQTMNGLIKPTAGGVYYNGADIWDDDYDIAALRGKVGMVFQYPEHQLFETSVIKDVCFGPKNIGMSQLDVEMNAYNALKMVGIDESLIDSSPFELSGGQKRRVAIAGILAMKPQMIILDEPTAGLDPVGRCEILDLIRRLNKKEKMTVVLVSHSMEDVAEYVDRVIVMDDGKVAMDGPARKIFTRENELMEMGLDVPQVTKLFNILKKNGIETKNIPITIDEAYDILANQLFG